MSKKFIILFIVFIDVLGIGVIMPILPFFVQSFNSSPQVVTWLFAIFSLCSFFSAPILGAMSDHLGRRPILLVSILSSAIGWLVFGLANSLWMLFLGRVIDGLAAGNISTAQSYMSDLAKDDKERLHNMGSIGMIFGIGFIIGPAIGGFLGHFGHRIPFLFVGALAFINLILAWIYLPETRFAKEKKPWNINQLNPFTPIKRALNDKLLRTGFISWFLFGVAIAAQQSSFSLYLQRVFNFKEAVVGIFMTGMGVVIAVNQGYLLKNFWIKYFNAKRLEIMMFIFMIIGFGLMSSSWLLTFIIGLIAVAFAQSVLRPVMTNQLATDHERRGEVLGIMASVISLSMIIGPIVAGWLFELKPNLAFIFASLVAFSALLLILRSRKLTKQQQLEAIEPPVSW